MSTEQGPPHTDIWSRWLLHTRNGGNEAFEAAMQTEVEAIADRVIDGAQLAPGMTLCDVGTGDGLVAFRAIERLGPDLDVVMTDISSPLLRQAQLRAAGKGVSKQCTFHECSAERLSLADASVDAVTTRAVLAYVGDKKAALCEFQRVLTPGGRISLMEPILQDEAYTACALRKLAEVSSNVAKDPFLPLLHRWKSAQFPDTQEKLDASPLTNYSERTLFELLRVCGFRQIHLEFHMNLRPTVIPTWQVFADSSPHPLAPSLSTIMAEQMTVHERAFFEKTMRPMVESRQAMMVDRSAYFTAVKVTA